MGFIVVDPIEMMGRADDIGDAIGHGQTDHRQGLVEVFGPVIDTGEEMAMNIHTHMASLTKPP